jgi:hypothetical protein
MAQPASVDSTSTVGRADLRPGTKKEVMMIPAEASLERYSVFARETLPATFGYIISLLQRTVREDY